MTYDPGSPSRELEYNLDPQRPASTTPETPAPSAGTLLPVTVELLQERQLPVPPVVAQPTRLGDDRSPGHRGRR